MISGFRKNDAYVSWPKIHICNRSSSIIEELRKLQETETKTGIAFFYCDGSYREKQNPRFILGSLFKQLLSQTSFDLESPSFSFLKEFYDSNREKKFRTRSSLLQFNTFISEIYPFFSQVYLVIDGVDECQDREQFFTLLGEIGTDNTHILATSRYEQDIARCFKQWNLMHMEDTAVNRDIQIYIDTRFAAGEKLSKIRPELKAMIRTKLLERSQGM
jgi:hypothetical protein